MPIYIVAYFWRCVQAYVYGFRTEPEAIAKLEEIQAQRDYSEDEDCITWEVVQISDEDQRAKIKYLETRLTETYSTIRDLETQGKALKKIINDCQENCSEE